MRTENYLRKEKHFKSLINHIKESLLNVPTVHLGMNEITLKGRTP